MFATVANKSGVVQWPLCLISQEVQMYSVKIFHFRTKTSHFVFCYRK